MFSDLICFRVCKLAATVPEGVSIDWQGKEFDSGPLTIELDEEAPASGGMLDYTRHHAQADFHVRLAFPELASLLEALGVDPELTRPVRAILHSEGEILQDHSFVLSGNCELAAHEILSPLETTASVLPGD